MKMRTRGIYLGVLCCVTYGLAYMCRINLPAAAEKMTASFSAPISRIGLFGTLQTLIYAFGQLVNGYFISRSRHRAPWNMPTTTSAWHSWPRPFKARPPPAPRHPLLPTTMC